MATPPQKECVTPTFSEHDIIENPQTRVSYEILSLINTGGFGAVYKGVMLTPLRKQVAIKCIPRTKKIPMMTENHGGLIPQEVHYMNMLTSVDGILQLVDWWIERHHLIMILEKPEASMDLSDYITETYYVVEPKAQKMFRIIFNTVLEMSNVGVFHRDLKSENVVLSIAEDTFIPYIIDFGCATEYDEDRVYTSLTGTRSDFPPEYRSEREYKCEGHTVWNLGCLLFEMVTGKTRFDENGNSDGNFQYSKAVSKDLRHLISVCLEPDPSRRATLETIANHRWVRENNQTKRRRRH